MLANPDRLNLGQLNSDLAIRDPLPEPCQSLFAKVNSFLSRRESDFSTATGHTLQPPHTVFPNRESPSHPFTIL